MSHHEPEAPALKLRFFGASSINAEENGALAWETTRDICEKRGEFNDSATSKSASEGAAIGLRL
jgi:hypothetical protein